MGLLSEIEGGEDFLTALREHQKEQDGLKLKQAVGYKGPGISERIEVAKGEVENVATPGGIDLRKIDITSQPVNSEVSEEQGGRKADDLESARTLVEMAVEYRHIPSTSRIKDWISFAVKSNQFQEERGKILVAIAGILRLEEEECTPTDNSLCEILILLEQDKPSKELYSCLSGI
jgi:hypothetical protein